MKSRMCILVALFPLAGCVDTPDSVAKEFRNANNEHIDAMMMVTNDTQAERMTVRVFSRMKERYDALDKKWDIMQQGMGRNPSQDTIREFLWADGVHLYRAEYRPNAQRFTLEMARLRDLYKKTLDAAKKAAQDRGEDPDKVIGENVCKALHTVVMQKATLDPLRGQLEKPKMEQLLQFFENRAEKDTFKIYKEKADLFRGRAKGRDGKEEDIVLVN